MRRALCQLLVLGALAASVLLCATGCKEKEGKADLFMVVQPKYNPMDRSEFFADGRSARTPVAGTIPIGKEPMETNIEAVHSVRSPDDAGFPFKLTEHDLARGHEVFTVYCSVCHGQLGDGNGMIAQRGFLHPPSFYLKRLRDVQPGHFYDVMTNGFGAMYSYNERVSSDDRWRVAGYIRALQLSNPNDDGLRDTPPTQRN